MLAKMAIENRKKYEMNMIVSSSIDYTMADMGLDTSAYDWNAIVEVIAGSSQKDQDELEEVRREAKNASKPVSHVFYVFVHHHHHTPLVILTRHSTFTRRTLCWTKYSCITQGKRRKIRALRLN